MKYRTTEFAPPSSRAAREVRRNSPIRQARTCYDHLAGVAGVTLMEALLRQGWLEAAGESRGRTHFRLTRTGEQALLVRGVDWKQAGTSHRIYAYGCLDWTERRFHLGGALGASIQETLRNSGIIQRERGTRVVALLRPLDDWLADCPGETS